MTGHARPPGDPAPISAVASSCRRACGHSRMEKHTHPTIFMVAGEASGDLHGANLVRHLRPMLPGARFFGIGGEAMAAQGVEIAFDCADLAVVGLTEVVGKMSTILRAFAWAAQSLGTIRPDVAILIDFPDFNLRVAGVARRKGIPVVYYIAPQVWAWRRGRIGRIAERVTKLLVIFPFEEDLFRGAGVDATYVGHPLLDALGEAGPLETDVADWGLSPLYPVVGLFPGSRPREVDVLLPPMMDAAARLRQVFPRMQFVLGQAPSLDRARIDRLLAGTTVPVRRIDGHTHRAMQICDAAIVASGTATLELAFFEVPMVIVYKVSALTYLIGRSLVRVPSIGLANVVSGKQIVPELIQGEVTGRGIFEACVPLVTNSVYRAAVKKELRRVRAALGEPGASRRAAECVLSIVGRPTGTVPSPPA